MFAFLIRFTKKSANREFGLFLADGLGDPRGCYSVLHSHGTFGSNGKQVLRGCLLNDDFAHAEPIDIHKRLIRGFSSTVRGLGTRAMAVPDGAVLGTWAVMLIASSIEHLLWRFVLLVQNDHSVDHVPTSPAVHLFIEESSLLGILRGEEVNEILSIGEDDCFLLTLDGIAESFRGSEIATHLALLGSIDVEICQMAKNGTFLVRWLCVVRLGSIHLAIVQERQPSLIPFARFGRVVHLYAEATGRLFGAGDGLDLEVMVALGSVARHDEQGILLIAVPGVHHVTDSFISTQATLQTENKVAFNNDTSCRRQVMPCRVGRGCEDVHWRSVCCNWQVDCR